MLAVNMPRLKAQKRLDEIELDTQKMLSLHPDELYDLVMDAKGSEALANAYRVARIKADWKHR